MARAEANHRTLQAARDTALATLTYDYDDVRCDCGWEGTENELTADFYDTRCMANPPATCCPACGADCGEQ